MCVSSESLAYHPSSPPKVPGAQLWRTPVLKEREPCFVVSRCSTLGAHEILFLPNPNPWPLNFELGLAAIGSQDLFLGGLVSAAGPPVSCSKVCSRLHQPTWTYSDRAHMQEAKWAQKVTSELMCALIRTDSQTSVFLSSSLSAPLRRLAPPQAHSPTVQLPLFSPWCGQTCTAPGPHRWSLEASQKHFYCQ